MKTIEISKLSSDLSDFDNKSLKEPIVLTKKGKPFAAIVGLPNTDLETLSLSDNSKFIALLERSRARLKKEGGVSLSEMKKRLKIK